MFERFTDRARRVLVLAQEEARDLNHAFIGTEHILLGLIREGEGVAARALDALGVTYGAVREEVRGLVEPITNASSGSPPFTPGAKKALELSLREALQLRHSYIGAEHMLLGLVRQGEGAAVHILTDLDVELSDLQNRVTQLMSGQSAPEVGNLRREAQFHGAVFHEVAPLDSVVFRGVVRAIGQQLRPDLDAMVLDDMATTISDELLHQLRRYWDDPGVAS
jgi:ATP-dependent Clp protease ATP-binding subunit ClpC